MKEDYFKIKKKKRKIEDLFLTYFQNKNYHLSKQVPLVTDDKSVLFTNATIIPWKRYLLGAPIPKEGLCMKQSCLRLHVLNDNIIEDAYYETSFNRFLGYFNMIGILTHSENRENVIDDLFNLFSNYYHIPLDDINILASSKDSFVEGLEKKFNVKYDTESDSFYSWVYGMNGVYGKGATFCLKQKSGKFKEIGQLIKIVNSNGFEFYEAGFGIETFLSRLESRRDYSAWTIFHCVPENFRFKTLLDLASCFGASLSICPELIGKKHTREIKRLARRIAYAEKIYQIPTKILEDAINKFINLEFNLDLKESVSQKLDYARELIQNE